MCGITGFLGHGTRGDRREILARMTGSLRHRGPDEEGVPDFRDERRDRYVLAVRP
jgi:asparagine synthetase B (glutamine-hydrolysing)